MKGRKKYKCTFEYKKCRGKLREGKRKNRINVKRKSKIREKEKGSIRSK